MILLKVGIKQIDNNNNNNNNKQSLYLNMIIPLHLIHEKKGEFWYWTECTNSYIYKMSNTNLFLSNFIFITVLTKKLSDKTMNIKRKTGGILLEPQVVFF
jgi:hypothetical protein